MSEPPRRADGGRRWPRTAIAGLGIVHVACALATFVTMDLGVPLVRDLLDLAIDTYELVGFGIYPVGVLVVTAALVLAWIWT